MMIDINPDTVNNLLNNQSFILANTRLDEFMDMVRKGTMSSFWMSYVDLVSLLLNLIRASREGNWNLHLLAINELIPWCFVYDRTNYARYLPWYLLQMLNT